jgi:MmeI, C-terminal domain
MPPVPEYALDQLEPLAQAVLDARTAHPNAVPADLYDPDLMPSDLRKAHLAIDRAVDRLYRRSGFSAERERIEHLFGLYEKLTSSLIAEPKKARNRRA